MGFLDALVRHAASGYSGYAAGKERGRKERVAAQQSAEAGQLRSREVAANEMRARAEAQRAEREYETPDQRLIRETQLQNRRYQLESENKLAELRERKRLGLGAGDGSDITGAERMRDADFQWIQRRRQELTAAGSSPDKALEQAARERRLLTGRSPGSDLLDLLVADMVGRAGGGVGGGVPQRPATPGTP